MDFFLNELELRGFWYRKIYPYCHISKYPSFWRGTLSKKVMVFEARKPSKDGMEDGFFLLAIARRSSME